MKTKIKIGDVILITSKRGSETIAKITDIDDEFVHYTDLEYPNVGACSQLINILFGCYYTVKIIKTE